MSGYLQNKIKGIEEEHKRVVTLFNMLNEKVEIYCKNEGAAGFEYNRNANASKTAICNQITTLRNELLVLAETFKY